MPMHPVTSTLMYRGMCTIPDILSYSAPVNLPEDEVEGETASVYVCTCVRVRVHVCESVSEKGTRDRLVQRRAVSTMDSVHDTNPVLVGAKESFHPFIIEIIIYDYFRRPNCSGFRRQRIFVQCNLPPTPAGIYVVC